MAGVAGEDEWKAITLTHVEYPKGDVIGFLFAWLSLMPFCIIVAFITLILFRRDLHTISYLSGLLLSESINWILKHVIKEPRPQRGRTMLYTEYGMPSSHAQFMWFFSTYLTCFLFIRVYRNYNIVEDIWKIATSIGGFLLALGVSCSRLYLGYHSVLQVVTGGLVGVVLGLGWMAVVQLLLTPIFPLLASNPVGEFLMLRDSTLIPHVLWFEYTSSRAEARSRQRKVTGRKSQ